MHKIKRSVSLLLSLLVILSFSVQLVSAQTASLSEEAAKYISQGDSLAESGEFDQAIDSYDQAITIEPKNVEPYFRKAQVLTTLNRNDKAVGCYDQMILLDPENIIFYIKKFNLLFEMKKYNEVFDCLNKILDLDPLYDTMLYRRAQVASLLNKNEDALSSLKKAIDLDSKYKVSALTDNFFDNIKLTPGFKNLMGIGVRIDGKIINFDVLPTVIKGRTLLPLRAVFESLGAKVEWEPKTKTVTGMLDDITIILKINSTQATVNNDVRLLDVPASIKDGRTLVPIRFVSETFGAAVEWDADTKMVDITTKDDHKMLSPDEEIQIIKDMDILIDKYVVDGLYSNPYNLKSNEGMIFFIAKTQEAVGLFKSISNESKKKYFNDYIQSHWGDIIGCESVHALFVFNNRKYAALDTSYNADSKNLVLKTYKQGMEMNVVIQNKTNDTYGVFP